MPHHGSTSTLRPRSEKLSTGEVVGKESSLCSDMRSWTAIKLLKYGLENKIYRKKGWLFDYYKKEGDTL
jgi:hypothetical protein